MTIAIDLLLQQNHEHQIHRLRQRIGLPASRRGNLRQTPLIINQDRGRKGHLATQKFRDPVRLKTKDKIWARQLVLQKGQQGHDLHHAVQLQLPLATHLRGYCPAEGPPQQAGVLRELTRLHPQVALQGDHLRNCQEVRECQVIRQNRQDAKHGRGNQRLHHRQHPQDDRQQRQDRLARSQGRKPKGQRLPVRAERHRTRKADVLAELQAQDYHRHRDRGHPGHDHRTHRHQMIIIYDLPANDNHYWQTYIQLSSSYLHPLNTTDIYLILPTSTQYHLPTTNIQYCNPPTYYTIYYHPLHTFIQFKIFITYMASKYLQKFPVPSGFQQVLADLTRQVLRDQPSNIIEYAALYFESLERGTKLQYKQQGGHNAKKGDEIAKRASEIAGNVEIKKQSIAENNVESKKESIHSQPGQIGTEKTVTAEETNNYVNNLEKDMIRKEEEQESKPEPPQAEQQESKPEAQVEMTPQLESAINTTVDQVFITYDTDNNGYLDSKELLKLANETIAQIQDCPKIDNVEEQAKKAMTIFDTDKDGRISKEELKVFVKTLFGIMPQEAPVQPVVKAEQASQVVNNEQVVNTEQVVKAQQVAKTEQVASTEQVVNTEQQSQSKPQGEVPTINEAIDAAVDLTFKTYDKDQNGYLDSKELLNIINQDMANIHNTPKIENVEEEVKKFMEVVDSNKDGKITKQQLKVFVTSLFV